MIDTFDPCKPLKTRGGGRGPKLTLCASWMTDSSKVDDKQTADFAAKLQAAMSAALAPK